MKSELQSPGENWKARRGFGDEFECPAESGAKPAPTSPQPAVLVMTQPLAVENCHNPMSRDWYPSSFVTGCSMLLALLVRKGTSGGQKWTSRELTFGFVHLLWLMKRAKAY